MAQNSITIDDIQKAVAPVAEKYGVTRVYLFGSYARGDNGEGSDIDLRIDSGRIRTLWQLSGFRLAIIDNLNAKVDVLTTNSLDESFLQRIKDEEVLVYAQ